MTRRHEHGYLTCLTCGPYQGAEAPVRTVSPGRVQVGGFAGRSSVCECCAGFGKHLADHGVPRCQGLQAVEARRDWRLAHPDPQWPDTIKAVAYERADRTWIAETDERTFASLAGLYGPERAEQMMAQEPPL